MISNVFRVTISFSVRKIVSKCLEHFAKNSIKCILTPHFNEHSFTRDHNCLFSLIACEASSNSLIEQRMFFNNIYLVHHYLLKTQVCSKCCEHLLFQRTNERTIGGQSSRLSPLSPSSESRVQLEGTSTSHWAN